MVFDLSEIKQKTKGKPKYCEKPKKELDPPTSLLPQDNILGLLDSSQVDLDISANKTIPQQSILLIIEAVSKIHILRTYKKAINNTIHRRK